MAGLELNLVGAYSSYLFKDGKTTPKLILQEAEKNFWAPSHGEFIDVVRQGSKGEVRMVRSISDFRDSILLTQEGGARGQSRRARSIQRVNVFAHGNAENIGLTGQVRQPAKDAKMADVWIGTGQNAINSASMDLLDQDTGEVEQSGDQAAKVFVEDGGLYLYACHSGGQREVMQRLADYFQIATYGFTGEIKFCPTNDVKVATGVPRGASGIFYRLGEDACASGPFDFHKLVPSMTMRPKKRTPDKQQTPRK